MKILVQLSAFVLSAFFVAGCISIGGSDRPIRTYVFEPSLRYEHPAGGDGRVLLVSPIRAVTGYNTHRMVYTDNQYELRYFAYSVWADSPTRMLDPLLHRVLEASGAFGAVVGPSNSGLAGVRLDTDVLYLYQDFTVEPNVVRFAIRLQVIDLHDRCILATEVVEASEPTASGDAYGGVTAINQVLTYLLESMVYFVDDAVTNHHCPER